jgi:hypothetical protein
MSDMEHKVKVQLQKFEFGKDDSSPHVFKYLLEHHNGKTSVEQVLTISSMSRLFDIKWTASIALDDFIPQSSPEAAALKMADWLERLALAIRAGEYLELPIDTYKSVVKK